MAEIPENKAHAVVEFKRKLKPAAQTFDFQMEFGEIDVIYSLGEMMAGVAQPEGPNNRGLAKFVLSEDPNFIRRCIF